MCFWLYKEAKKLCCVVHFAYLLKRSSFFKHMSWKKLIKLKLKDRMTYAVMGFVEEKLGPKFVENRSVEFAKSYEESGERRNLIKKNPEINIR